LGTYTFSQNLTVSGKIADLTDAPLEAAEILLFYNGTVIANELTNENGDFRLTNLAANPYFILVRQLGDTIFSQNIHLAENLDFGTIKVQNSKQLQEITVTAQKKLIERKVDRLVFNIENSIAAAGGDALDALKVTPGIRVQNDQISMTGKSGMALMVNERIIQLSGDDLANYLKSIPSDNIQSIEVITTPPAKYEAEGNSGIVNIVLKKVKDNSWNGYISGSYTQSKYARFNESTGFNYNKNKLSFYANLFHNDGTDFYRTENEKIYYTNKFYNSFSKMKYNYGANISANTGLDYAVTKKISFGIQYIYNYKKTPNTDDNDTRIFASPNFLIQTTANSENINKGNNLNFHSTLKLDTLGRKIDLNLDCFNNNSTRDRTFQTNEYEDFTNLLNGNFTSVNNGSHQNVTNYSVKIDIEHPLKCLNLTYGGRISFTKNNTSLYFYDLASEIPVFQANISDEFQYKEN
jgi:hypothetical protein